MKPPKEYITIAIKLHERFMQGWRITPTAEGHIKYVKNENDGQALSFQNDKKFKDWILEA
ncbi:hypothetical protein CN984_12655 [Bacillus cereus]|uniref:Uncharacterized protein n=1 Tax=Bacillus cereus TaxID=1396 RepID=A0A2B9Q325_BACCE|nr:hypothetical protein [Bacillus cereus]PEA25890.1 hypothetical protein CON44_18300 [Bacillus cereus]PGO29268.1 hypothetical protein CN984_12655 [Bacillus cereus]